MKWAAFNDAHRAAQARFGYCNRDAEDYAARERRRRQALVARRLSAPLVEAARGADAQGVVVFRGGQDPQ
ncbi:MAG: hypothetical protein R3C42_08870 [Parvularculaceae bacterium]